MKALLAAPAAAFAVFGAVLGAPRAHADSGTVPQRPFIDHTRWARWQGLPSLRVYPTPSGRAVARADTGSSEASAAWAEVVALSPDADTPGMRAQFVCHWQLAELAEPGKASWNLEPWRPVVDDAEMFATGCNPGGRQEAS